MYNSTNTISNEVVMSIDTSSIERMIEQTNNNIRYLNSLGIGLDQTGNNFINSQMVISGYNIPKTKKIKHENRTCKKEHIDAQKKQMNLLDKTIEDRSPVKYMKANVIANKAVAIKFGFKKAIKKANMTEEMLKFRDIILEKITALMIAKDMGVIDHVSKIVYASIERV